MRSTPSATRRAALFLLALMPLAALAVLVLLGVSRDLDRALELSLRGPSLSELCPSIPGIATAIRSAPNPPRLAHRLASRLVPPQSRGIRRRMQTAAFALVLQLRYSREGALLHYLNRVRMGSARGVPITGFAQAAAAYFGVPPSRLTTGETAILCDLALHLRAGTPLTHPEEALKLRNQVLLRLRDAGVLSESEYRTESALPLSLAPDRVPVN